jgi:transposase, IS6 family
MTDARAFRGYRFPAEVILWAVRWYLRFPLSYRDLERMLADRGVAVDHTTMYRWVQRFAPELEKRMRRHLRPCRGPWHVDATYLRVGGPWRYLYRAVDGTGRSAGLTRGSTSGSASGATRGLPDASSARRSVGRTRATRGRS